MKEFKTFNQQLTILRNRGMIVPTDGSPKRFLEQENYYNVINGYKDLFLCKDAQGNAITPETYLPNSSATAGVRNSSYKLAQCRHIGA